jgi:hypothetical protein
MGHKSIKGSGQLTWVITSTIPIQVVALPAKIDQGFESHNFTSTEKVVNGFGYDNTLRHFSNQMREAFDRDNDACLQENYEKMLYRIARIHKNDDDHIIIATKARAGPVATSIAVNLAAFLRSFKASDPITGLYRVYTSWNHTFAGAPLLVNMSNNAPLLFKINTFQVKNFQIPAENATIFKSEGNFPGS